MNLKFRLLVMTSKYVQKAFSFVNSNLIIIRLSELFLELSLCYTILIIL